VVCIAGENFYFVFEKWLAVEQGDGKVEREIMATDRGLGFYKVINPFITTATNVMIRIVININNNTRTYEAHI